MSVYKFDLKKIQEDGKMDEFQKAMNELADAQALYMQELAAELSISYVCAMNIVYLRSRSRWTQALEDELVRMDKAGEPEPNMNEWPAG